MLSCSVECLSFVQVITLQWLECCVCLTGNTTVMADYLKYTVNLYWPPVLLLHALCNENKYIQKNAQCKQIISSRGPIFFGAGKRRWCLHTVWAVEVMWSRLFSEQIFWALKHRFLTQFLLWQVKRPAAKRRIQIYLGTIKEHRCSDGGWLSTFSQNDKNLLTLNKAINYNL